MVEVLLEFSVFLHEVVGFERHLEVFFKALCSLEEDFGVVERSAEIVFFPGEVSLFFVKVCYLLEGEGVGMLGFACVSGKGAERFFRVEVLRFLRSFCFEVLVCGGVVCFVGADFLDTLLELFVSCVYEADDAFEAVCGLVGVAVEGVPEPSDVGELVGEEFFCCGFSCSEEDMFQMDIHSLERVSADSGAERVVGGGDALDV